MDSEQWNRVRELCNEASKLAPAERDAFLRQHCADKLELMAEVVRLLNSSDGATVLAADSGSGQLYAVHGDRGKLAFVPNEVLAGRFRIVRFISRGGMGEVYAAEDLQLGGQVAVKPFFQILF